MIKFFKINRFVALVAFALCFGVTSIAQETTIEYLSTNADIANPERGWYDQFTTHSGGANLGSIYSTISTRGLINDREDDNMTLILRLFMLHEFLEEDNVSSEYLSKVQADFDSIRNAGMKVIVRFAYSRSQDAEIWDATPEKVFSHIASLGDVLDENADIIATVQAGFIGAWGEWYYTKNFATSGYSPNDADKLNRIAVVQNLLDVLPDNIVVEARTPSQMRYLTKTDDPITQEEAFDGTFKSRVGHHNDCFLANASDYGTYGNLAEDLAYLHESTKYTITGGETCDGSNSYSDCVNSVPRMVELHWTYMNRGYNKAVYSKWEEQGCYEEVNIGLGYRIRLEEAIIPNSIDPGNPLVLSFKFQNDGYAAPTQIKPVQIVLRHTVSGDTTILNYTGTNDDIRYWLPGEILSIGTIDIPGDLAHGNYIMSLRIPDKDSDLALIPAYSIQLAVAGTWDKENGINRLNHILSVGSEGIGAFPEIPGDLAAEPRSKTEIELSWTDNLSDETGFEIMRAEGDGMAWQQVAVLDANTVSYSDINLTRGTYYHYIIRSMNEYGYSSWSDSISTATLGVYVPMISILPINIFPNPLGDNEDLTIEFANFSKKNIEICDISGKNVFEYKTENDRIQISRDIFDSGLYLVRARSHYKSVEKVLVIL